MDTLKIDFDRIYNIKKKDGAVLALENDIIVFDDEYLTENSILNLEAMSPIRLDARAYILCMSGDMTLNIDYKTYKLTKGSIFRLNGRHIIDDIYTSNNYRGYSLLFSQDFIISIINWIPEIKDLSINADRFKPLMKFDEAELQKFIDIIEHLKRNLRTINHIFYSEIVKIEAANFILELADIFAKKISGKEGFIEKEGRRTETIRQFMSLVMDHCKEQHEVSFYAKELNMTPGNLSRVITSASGKSPIKWISSALIAEAKIFLRNPDMNIQQVSLELNFADQSSFGKFFKKHTGLTPIEYKEKIRNVQMF